MSNLKGFTRTALFIVGIAAVCFAVAVSNAGLTQMLLGQETKDLSWGATLFRVLLFLHGGLLVAVSLLWKEPAEVQKKHNTNENTPISPSVWIGLIALSAIALALRLWNLNADLWVDEILTLTDFVRQPLGEILTSFPNKNQHMFYSVLARLAINIFGESAWSLRLPSVLFGLGSIWALFFLCRRLLGIREALFCCALMTVSYHHIWFSQNARGYMGLLFLTLLATWFWFEALEKNKWGRWLAYAGAIVLGMWIHMTMAFVVAAHGLVYLALAVFPRLNGDEFGSLERRAGIKPFVAWTLSVTVTLQLYALALPQLLREGLHEESKNSEWTHPLWVLTETVTNLSIGFAGFAVVVAGVAFIVFGWVKLFQKNRRAAVLMTLPPIFAGVFMLALGHNLFPRFFFFAMGFGLLIVIYGAMQLPELFSNFISTFRHKRVAVYSGIAFVILIIAASIITVPRNYSLPKQNFTGAKDFIENQKAPSDEVVAVRIAGEMYSKYFITQWSVARELQELETIQQKGEKVWLVYTLAPEIKAFRPEMWRTIERDYEVVRVFPGTLNGGEIFVCQRRNTKEQISNESSRNFSQSEDNPVWQATVK